MRKILRTSSLFKIAKMNNSFKFFKAFKICYYLQLNLPNQNTTHEFLKSQRIIVEPLRLPDHFFNNKL